MPGESQVVICFMNSLTNKRKHEGPYYGFSNSQMGKVKIVGDDYVPLPGDKATIIYFDGG